jgi:hypothetical protein
MGKKLFKQGKRKKKETKRNRVKINKTKRKSNKTKRKSNKTKIKRRINLHSKKAGLRPGKAAVAAAALGVLSTASLGVGPAVAAATFGGVAGIMGAGIYNNTRNTIQPQLVEGDPLLTEEGALPLIEEGALPLIEEGALPLIEEGALPLIEQTSRRQTQTLPTVTMQEIIDISSVISDGGEKLITKFIEILKQYIEGTIKFEELKNILSSLNWSIYTTVGSLTISHFQEPIMAFLKKIEVHERLQVLRELSTRLKTLGRSGSGQQARRRAAGPIKLDGGGKKTKRRKPKRR